MNNQIQPIPHTESVLEALLVIIMNRYACDKKSTRCKHRFITPPGSSLQSGYVTENEHSRCGLEPGSVMALCS